MVQNRKKGLDVFAQRAKLLKYFPDSKVTVERNILTWKYTLSPTPLSESYDIKLVYRFGYHPDIYVVNRKLNLFPGELNLPHVYNTEKQWLCLYYRKAKEWNNQKFIADTIVPWISEWLYHYEFWLATGEWHGKGIHGNFKPYKKDKAPEPIEL